jgi:inosine/xanthosine triphosphate pyrophosphatase family protein
MAPPKELNFITGNKNKLAEVQAILSETAIDLRSQAVDLVEIQGTIEEISRDKAIRAAEAVCLFFFYFSVSQTVFYTGIFLYHKWKLACGRMGKLRLFDECIANEVE